MRTIFYLLREAWANIWTNRTTTVVAIFTTAFTLACVGVEATGPGGRAGAGAFFGFFASLLPR